MKSAKLKNQHQHSEDNSEAKEPYLKKLRHTCEHVLTQAMHQLYGKDQVVMAMGPATEDGFYFDFDSNEDFKFSEAQFAEIEQNMQEIIDQNLALREEDIEIDQARELFSNNPYKQEWLDEIESNGQKATVYWTGDEFVDLCKGPHVEKTGEIKAFKLLSIAGAYWHGDEKNKMLTRVYGTAFSSKEELGQFLHLIEEAKRRDHRKLGQELDLFVFSDLVGKGLPLFTPKGTVLRELLNEFSQGLRLEKGFQRVWIPHITKNDLYKVSGHWDKFGDELFLVKSQETSDELVMKPMNCPHHQQIFASRQRSYKDLPIKYLETTAIYRDEKAGELLGLSRVRSATQDDSHIFCTPDQIEEVYQELIEVVHHFYDALGMKYRARLSFWDSSQEDKYLGEAHLWERAQEILLEIAKKNELDYYIAEGEAAFYGPKIDFMVLDALGREWQLGTPQLDFVQPKRFGLTYVDSSGQEQTPVMIHFALMGSLERFLSVYIEHTAGAFPFWLAPVQVKILPVSDKFSNYAQQLKQTFISRSLRVELDDRAERLQAKIRDAQLEKVPHMLIVGGKEVEQSTVTVRRREGGEQEVLSIEEYLKLAIEKVQTKSLDY